MLSQNLPPSALAYQRDQQREIAGALLAVRRQWRRVGAEFDAGYRAVEPALLAVVTGAQLRVAEGAAGYVPAVLDDTGQSRALRARIGDVVPGAVVGVDGSGRPIAGLLAQSTVTAKMAVAAGRTAPQALTAAGQWLTTAIGTLLSDTARAVEVVGMANHKVGGYVRMLSPPSCSRCAILAGKWSRDSVAFQRHPGCDCRHIPASEAVADGLLTDPRDYFENLEPADQDRIFGQAGAAAIREGADLGQVVNARRGMRAAQIGGRDVLITTEGTTRRGVAYRSLSPSRSSDVRLAGSRYASARRPRMMPETLRQVSTDRDDFIRLLRANGYIT